MKDQNGKEMGIYAALRGKKKGSASSHITLNWLTLDDAVQLLEAASKERESAVAKAVVPRRARRVVKRRTGGQARARK